MSSEKYKIDEVYAAQLKEKVEGLRGGITEKAHHLVYVVMPQRVLALTELFAKTPEISDELDGIHGSFEFSVTNGGGDDTQGESKKRKAASGESVVDHDKVVPSNKLNIPKIEDGNNFGVSIQEETVGELGRAEDSGYALLENLSKYFVARAKLVSKVLKYPGIQDYRKSVQELDEKEYVNLKLSCLDLRNNYAILYDMITKNMDKIRAPRPSSHLNSMF